MAVRKEYNWDWVKSTSTSSATSPYLQEIKGNVYYTERFNYYKEYYATWKLERPIADEIGEKRIAEILHKYVEKDIMNDLNNQYVYGEPESAPFAFEVLKFDPENLWSEPKCLKTDIVQSLNQK